jgi:hypothetical protein
MNEWLFVQCHSVLTADMAKQADCLLPLGQPVISFTVANSSAVGLQRRLRCVPTEVSGYARESADVGVWKVPTSVSGHTTTCRGVFY